MEKSEKEIVKKIISIFHELVEEKSALKKSYIDPNFDFMLSGRKYHCKTEEPLKYALPNGYTLEHKTDIFIGEGGDYSKYLPPNPDHKFVLIEVKYKSARTDSFKSRSYDMMHLRTTFPKCLGVLMYIRELDITPEHAKNIGYPYHKFFSCSTKQLTAKKLSPLFDEIVSFLKEQ